MTIEQIILVIVVPVGVYAGALIRTLNKKIDKKDEQIAQIAKDKDAIIKVKEDEIIRILAEKDALHERIHENEKETRGVFERLAGLINGGAEDEPS